MEKLTNWFPEKIKPVRIGVYQVKINNHILETVGYAYWRGFSWAPVCVNEDYALQLSNYIGSKQSLIWRGLKK